MSSSNLFGLAGDSASDAKSAANEGKSSSSSSGGSRVVGPGGKLSSFLSSLKAPSERRGGESSSRASGLLTPRTPGEGALSPGASPHSAHSAHSASAAVSPSRAEAATAATLWSSSGGGARGAREATTKERFLHFFKSDAEKRAEREREKEQAAAAAAAQRAKASASATAEPIKLELRVVGAVDLAAPPLVGQSIRASGSILRSHGSPSPLPLGVGGPGVLRWFRAAGEGFEQVLESPLSDYTLTLDDVGARVCCQWIRSDDSDAASAARTEPDEALSANLASQSSFAELGPVLLDPAIAHAAADAFQGGTKAVFTVRDSESDELVQLVLKKSMIRLLRANRGGAGEGGAGAEAIATFMLMPKPAGSPPSVRFVLDSVDPTRFSIEDVESRKVFRGFIPWRETSAQGDSIAAAQAQARRQRDVLACLVRRLVRTGSPAVSEEEKESMGVAAQPAAPPLTAEAEPHDVPAGPLRDYSVEQSADTSSSSAATSSSSSSAAAPPTAAASASSSLDESSLDLVRVTVEPASQPDDSVESDLVRLVVQPASPPSTESSLSIRVSAPDASPAAASSMSDPSASPIAVVDTAPSSLAPSALLVSPSPSSSPLSSPHSSPASSAASHSPSVQSLSKRLSEVTAEKDLFKHNIRALMQEQLDSAARAAEEKSALEASLAAREAEVSSLRAELDRKGEEVDALKLAINNLSNQMAALANTEVRLSRELRVSKQEREAKEEAFKRERETREEAFKRERDEWEKQRATQANAYATLESAHKLQSEQVVSLESSLTQLRAELARLSSVDEKLTRASETESNLRHDLSVLKSECVKWRDMCAKLEAVELENHQLRKEKERRRRMAAEGIAAGSATSTPAASPAASTDNTPEAPHVQLPGSKNPSSSLDAAVASPSVPPSPPPSSGDASQVQDIVLTLPPLPRASHSHSRSGSRDLTPTPLARGPVTPSESTALTLLSEQHAQLQSSHAALVAEHESMLAELHSLREQLSSAQSQLSTELVQVESLRLELEDLRRAHEEVSVARNHWKKKCESLASSVEKMRNRAGMGDMTGSSGSGGPGPTPSPPPSSVSSDQHARLSTELRQAHAQLLHAKAENAQLLQTLSAYKQTMESTYALLKAEREANLMLKSSSSSGGGGLGMGALFGSGKSAKLASLSAQFESARSLAHDLSETVADRERTIDLLKRSNQTLANRVFQLERRFEAQLAEDTAQGLTSFGRIDLEAEERKWQREQEKSDEADVNDHSTDADQASAPPSASFSPASASASIAPASGSGR